MYLKLVSIIMVLFILLTGCACNSPIHESTMAITAAPTDAPIQPTAAKNDPTIVPATESVPLPDPLLLILDSMTPEEKVGQLFLARCPENSSIEDIVSYHLGGYILFGRDFQDESPESFREKIAAYQSCSPIPLLIAVDEEGGTVCRISNNESFRDSRFPSPRWLYENGGMDLVLETETEKAELLHALNINVNMAPVCDITMDPDAFMYSRSLGQSAKTTGYFASQVSDIMAKHQIGSVLKHFPGYGENSDTHTGIAIDDRPLSQLEEVDLVPFSMGIEAGHSAILVSHTFVNALDKEFPASLSLEVHRYIRQNMEFDGVIITDDLAMQAITDTYGVAESAIMAVQAGNDLLCSTDYQIQFQAVLNAVLDGRISQNQLDQAVLRILRWKASLGLLD